MDPLTHATFGAVAASLIARKRDAVRTAILAGAAGALVPDLDVLIRSEHDPLLTLQYHRHFTHALVFAPIAGLLVAALLRFLFFRKRERRPEFRMLWCWASIGAATAGLLDACTSYGTHLFWPFTADRVAWNLVAVVDPLFTLGLVAILAVIFFRRDPRTAPRMAMVYVATFFAFAGWQKSRVESARDALLAKRGHAAAAESLTVKPTLGNLLLWRSIYEHGDRFFIDAIRVGPIAGARIYEGDSLPALDFAGLVAELPPNSRLARDLARFERFSEGYLVRHPEQPDVIGDPRYAMLPDSMVPLWGIRIEESDPDAPVKWETFRRSDPAFRERFLAMLRGR